MCAVGAMKADDTAKDATKAVLRSMTGGGGALSAMDGGPEELTADLATSRDLGDEIEAPKEATDF